MRGFYLVRDARMGLDGPIGSVLRITNIGSVAMFAVGMVVVVTLVAARRANPYEHCCLALIVFLLANKVYSPQYDLWLVPMLVLVAAPLGRWVRLGAVDGAMFVLVFAFPPAHPLLLVYLVEVAVIVRVAVLVGLARLCWRRGALPGSWPAVGVVRPPIALAGVVPSGALS